MSGATCSITVTCYGPASALAGSRTIEVAVDAIATVGSLRAAIGAAQPGLAPLLPRCAIAVAGNLSSDDTALQDGDCVDLLPPVSGG